MAEKVADDHVVKLHYTLFVEDEELESTEGGNPIQFIQGRGQIIPGLEEALYGMSPGETQTVAVEAEDAYGMVDPDARQLVKIEEFSEEIPLEVGTFLDFRDEHGDVLSAQIIARDEETVTVDFNHPLAGKDLVFEVEIEDVRPADPEELDHGHVHEGHEH
jgi:FKBP-type peptidyl-prolyl cis-trans isomerase SlyD